MIRNALGPSPLETDVRDLDDILSSGFAPGVTAARATDWAVAAFRRAGADEVHIEKSESSALPNNVIAEVRGRDHPSDYVLIAVPLAGSVSESLVRAENAAMIVDAVRVIHATGNIPRRSIRFVTFGASDNAPDDRFAGVWVYVRRHRNDLDRLAAAVEIDAASGSLDGYSLGDRPDALAAVQKALEPLRPLGIRNFTEEVKVPTELTPFWLEGIPTLDATSKASTGAVPGGTRAGSTSSAIDAGQLQQLKRGVAIAAITAYALADAESRVAPRKSASEVQAAVSSHALMPKLKASGLWGEWHGLRSGPSH